MKAFWQNVRFLLAVASFVIIVLAVVLSIFGIRPFILKSGSMEPLYKKGSIVFINTKIKAEEVKVGDILVYRSAPKMLVMHRYVAKNTFQGDYNKTKEHVKLSNVNLVGKTIFVIPEIGTVIENLTRFPFIYWGLVVLFLILSCVAWKK